MKVLHARHIISFLIKIKSYVNLLVTEQVLNLNINKAYPVSG